MSILNFFKKIKYDNSSLSVFIKNSILLIFIISFIYQPSKIIFKRVYSLIITCASLESHCYIKSYNHMTSNNYKPYHSHNGGGNRLGFEFANEIIKKYYQIDKFTSPTFFNLPYPTNVKILLDGYRDKKNTTQSEFLIRNYNSLFKQEQIGKNKINVHGFFLDIDKINYETNLKINNKYFFNIKKKDLINCNDFLILKKPFTAADHASTKKNSNLIKQFENCFYFELTNNNNFNFTIKLNKNDKVENKNINEILYYGNGLNIDSYLVIERSPYNYNYFYAKVLN